MERRDREREDELKENAMRALRALHEYYEGVRLRGPMRLVSKAQSLLDFISKSGGRGP